MEKIESVNAEDLITFVHEGLGEGEEASKCDDDCVGGTANTKAMEATN